jgi:hypothetical protein
VVFVHGGAGRRGRGAAGAPAGRRGAACRRRRRARLGGPRAAPALRTAPTLPLHLPEQARPCRAPARGGWPTGGRRRRPPDAPPAPPPGAAAVARAPGGVLRYEPRALRAATVLRAAPARPRAPDLRSGLLGAGARDEGLACTPPLGIHHLLRAHDPGPRGAAPTRAATPRLAGARGRAWVLADGDDGAFGALDAMAAGVPVLAERGGTAARYVATRSPASTWPRPTCPARPPCSPSCSPATTRGARWAAGRARVARTYTEAAMVDGFARAAAAAAAGVRAAAGARARAR